jgi:hypothetical protein
MCDEDLHIVKSISQIFHPLEVDLALHGLISLLPILLRHGFRVLGQTTTQAIVCTRAFFIKRHAGMC